MGVRRALRTIDLARAAGVSVQQVRNFEARGLLPPVERSQSGYRRYGELHLAALVASVGLQRGYGALTAQAVMVSVHRGQISDGLAALDVRHADLASARSQLTQIGAAVDLLGAQIAAPAQQPDARIRVGAAAQQLGVTVASVHFWEAAGLVRPAREPESRYRIYDGGQLRRLRIVAMLRQANYSIATIREVLDELEAGQPQRAAEAIAQRRAVLDRTSRDCLTASAALDNYLRMLER